MESLDATRPLKFGAFELDVRLRELRKGSTRIRLQEQPFEILRLMLERPGDIVTREQLRQRLWPDGTYVDFEHSLNAAVKRLRAALGDDAENPRFVETLPRRGYRFIASMGEAAAPGGAGARPAGADEAAREAGRAAVQQPERRPGPGLLQRRPHRRDALAAGRAEPGPRRHHRAVVLDGVQGNDAPRA